jgi:hypothetical protein
MNHLGVTPRLIGTQSSCPAKNDLIMCYGIRVATVKAKAYKLCFTCWQPWFTRLS